MINIVDDTWQVSWILDTFGLGSVWGNETWRLLFLSMSLVWKIKHWEIKAKNHWLWVMECKKFVSWVYVCVRSATQCNPCLHIQSTQFLALLVPLSYAYVWLNPCYRFLSVYQYIIKVLFIHITILDAWS